MELQGGGVLVPGTVFLGLALAGRLVEERYGVNIRKDRHCHSADSREVNAPRQMSAVNPADSLYSGKYLSSLRSAFFNWLSSYISHRIKFMLPL